MITQEAASEVNAMQMTPEKTTLSQRIVVSLRSTLDDFVDSAFLSLIQYGILNVLLCVSYLCLIILSHTDKSNGNVHDSVSSSGYVTCMAGGHICWYGRRGNHSGLGKLQVASSCRNDEKNWPMRVWRQSLQHSRRNQESC